VYKHIDGREQSDNPSKPEGIIAIANAIPDMRAMTKFDISSNYVHAEGGKAVAAALKGNQLITDLNISDNALDTNSDYGDDTSGIIAIADAIPDMGALSKLMFGGDEYQKWNSDTYEDDTITPKPAVLEIGMTEADFSNKNVGVGGAIITAAWISHNDNGALTSLNLSSNCLTGDDGDDMSGNMLNPPVHDVRVTRYTTPITCYPFTGVAALANAIPDMRALLVLSLKGNNLGAAGGKALAEGLKGNQVITELNIADNNLAISGFGPDISGVIALADVIPDMGALLQLHVAGNSFGVEGARFFCDNLGLSARCVAEWFVNTKVGIFGLLNVSYGWYNGCCHISL
jgi:hypothetical protein